MRSSTAGGVLVPLDYKLSAREHLQLLAHSKAQVLIVEHHLWRAITQAEGFEDLNVKTVLVTEAPARCRPRGRAALGRGEGKRRAAVCCARTQGLGVHRLFVRHGRPAQRVRAHARKLPRTVRGADGALSFLAGRALPEHSCPPTTPSISWWDSSGRSCAARPSSTCARCGRNTFATPSRATRSLT